MNVVVKRKGERLALTDAIELVIVSAGRGEATLAVCINAGGSHVPSAAEICRHDAGYFVHRNGGIRMFVARRRKGQQVRIIDSVHVIVLEITMDTVQLGVRRSSTPPQSDPANPRSIDTNCVTSGKCEGITSGNHDNELQQRVTNFLHARGVPNARNLQIDARAGIVVVRGRLPSRSAKQFCLQCCQHVAGVVCLIDRLVISPRAERDSAA